MGTTIDIRDEETRDVRAIREVNRLAFDGDLEGGIVDALRDHGVLMLSLVAAAGDEVVGHIAYSPLAVNDVAGAALGPMAVQPGHQRQGIGSALVRAGNQRLRDMGCPFIGVVGHPTYYPRFGFQRASGYGMTSEWDLPDDVFMVLVLDPACAARLSGVAKYRHEFTTAAPSASD